MRARRRCRHERSRSIVLQTVHVPVGRQQHSLVALAFGPVSAPACACSEQLRRSSQVLGRYVSLTHTSSEDRDENHFLRHRNCSSRTSRTQPGLTFIRCSQTHPRIHYPRKKRRRTTTIRSIHCHVANQLSGASECDSQRQTSEVYGDFSYGNPLKTA